MYQFSMPGKCQCTSWWNKAANQALVSMCLVFSSCGDRSDARLDPGPFRSAKHPECVVGLQIQPDFRGYTEVLAETECGVCRYCPFSADNRADTIGRHVNIPGKSIDTDVQWLHEFLVKDLPGWNRFQMFPAHFLFL